MEVLPCEEVERVTGSKIHLQQGGYSQQSVSGAMNSLYT